MTVTRHDFAVIVRLSFFGEHVPVSNVAYMSTVVRNRWLKDFFRATAVMKSSCISLV